LIEKGGGRENTPSTHNDIVVDPRLVEQLRTCLEATHGAIVSHR
jgi:hypothetical protein